MSVFILSRFCVNKLQELVRGIRPSVDWSIHSRPDREALRCNQRGLHTV